MSPKSGRYLGDSRRERVAQKSWPVVQIFRLGITWRVRTPTYKILRRWVEVFGIPGVPGALAVFEIPGIPATPVIFGGPLGSRAKVVAGCLVEWMWALETGSVGCLTTTLISPFRFSCHLYSVPH